MRGIISYGTYVPYFRLRRSTISAALGTPAGSGSRAVASFDEDSTTMAVEAGHVAAAASNRTIESVLFATATPPYLDKTNATAIRAALGLGAHGFAGDVIGSVRSGFAALTAGLSASSTTLAVTADVRTGLPGSTDERAGGDGAAAFVLGTGSEDQVIAEYLGGASVSEEFLDRWRLPGQSFSRVWEERFGESVYVRLVDLAVTDALKSVGITAEQIDSAVISGLHTRAVRFAAKTAGLRRATVGDDLTALIGNTGTAHPGVLLANALDQAEPGQIIAVVILADGVDVACFRVTEAIVNYPRATTVADQIGSGNEHLTYSDFLTWRGHLDREPPRRPEPEVPAAPFSSRSLGWKFAFVGSRCGSCGTRHLPPQRVCVRCSAVDEMSEENLVNTTAEIATFTIDRLAHSLSPPVIAAVVDIHGGGRFQCELTDVDPMAVAVGSTVEFTFRRLYTAGGVHNYFWKARPMRRTRS